VNTGLLVNRRVAYRRSSILHPLGYSETTYGASMKWLPVIPAISIGFAFADDDLRAAEDRSAAALQRICSPDLFGYETARIP